MQNLAKRDILEMSDAELKALDFTEWKDVYRALFLQTRTACHGGQSIRPYVEMKERLIGCDPEGSPWAKMRLAGDERVRRIRLVMSALEQQTITLEKAST